MIKWGVKDGGPESPVTFYGIEIKSLFSIGILKFKKGHRENFHNHAFHALTWMASGVMVEERLLGVGKFGHSVKKTPYHHSIIPKLTKRDNMHRVKAFKDSICFTIRGPWGNIWEEFDPTTGRYIIFSSGRKVVGTYK